MRDHAIQYLRSRADDLYLQSVVTRLLGRAGNPEPGSSDAILEELKADLFALGARAFEAAADLLSGAS